MAHDRVATDTEQSRFLAGRVFPHVPCLSLSQGHHCIRCTENVKVINLIAVAEEYFY